MSWPASPNLCEAMDSCSVTSTSTATTSLFSVDDGHGALPHKGGRMSRRPSSNSTWTNGSEPRTHSLAQTNISQQPRTNSGVGIGKTKPGNSMRTSNYSTINNSRHIHSQSEQNENNNYNNHLNHNSRVKQSPTIQTVPNAKTDKEACQDLARAHAAMRESREDAAEVIRTVFQKDASNTMRERESIAQENEPTHDGSLNKSRSVTTPLFQSTRSLSLLSSSESVGSSVGSAGTRRSQFQRQGSDRSNSSSVVSRHSSYFAFAGLNAAQLSSVDEQSQYSASSSQLSARKFPNPPPTVDSGSQSVVGFEEEEDDISCFSSYNEKTGDMIQPAEYSNTSTHNSEYGCAISSSVSVDDGGNTSENGEFIDENIGTFNGSISGGNNGNENEYGALLEDNFGTLPANVTPRRPGSRQSGRGSQSQGRSQSTSDSVNGGVARVRSSVKQRARGGCRSSSIENIHKESMCNDLSLYSRNLCKGESGTVQDEGVYDQVTTVTTTTTTRRRLCGDVVSTQTIRHVKNEEEEEKEDETQRYGEYMSSQRMDCRRVAGNGKAARQHNAINIKDLDNDDDVSVNARRTFAEVNDQAAFEVGDGEGGGERRGHAYHPSLSYIRDEEDEDDDDEGQSMECNKQCDSVSGDDECECGAYDNHECECPNKYFNDEEAYVKGRMSLETAFESRRLSANEIELREEDKKLLVAHTSQLQDQLVKTKVTNAQRQAQNERVLKDDERQYMILQQRLKQYEQQQQQQQQHMRQETNPSISAYVYRGGGSIDNGPITQNGNGYNPGIGHNSHNSGSVNSYIGGSGNGNIGGHKGQNMKNSSSNNRSSPFRSIKPRSLLRSIHRMTFGGESSEQKNLRKFRMAAAQEKEQIETQKRMSMSSMLPMRRNSLNMQMLQQEEQQQVHVQQFGRQEQHNQEQQQHTQGEYAQQQQHAQEQYAQPPYAQQQQQYAQQLRRQETPPQGLPRTNSFRLSLSRAMTPKRLFSRRRSGLPRKSLEGGMRGQQG